MGSEHYCLRWNNHQSNLLGVFSQLLRDESLVDVTLACSEGHSIRAHKVVLSACSSYFQALFVDHPSRHPIVILKDVRFSELRTLIEFMYKGEVNVEYCQLSALLKTAESLKVKGLAEMTRDYKQEPEQIEPTELVGPRGGGGSCGSINSRQQQQPLTTGQQSSSSRSRSPSIDDNDRLQASQSPPPIVQNLRICNRSSPISSVIHDHQENETMSAAAAAATTASLKRPLSPENIHRNLSSSPVNSDCGPSDMTIHTNSNNMVPSCSGLNAPTNICARLPSPLGNEPLPGPSNMPPVQQVPLSLKKEVDWSGGIEDKNIGESSSDFTRHPHHDSASSNDIERPTSSPLERPSSTQSSRSSTPFALPFPSLPTSILEVGMIHPSLLGEEMFRCPSCMAAFPSIWLLEQHTALQHIGSLNSSLEKPFICEQCGQSYRYRSAYVKHREQNHRARLPADKLFSCDVCGMQFRYLKSFKKHRLNHALEKLHGKSANSSGGASSSNNHPSGAGSPIRNFDNSSDQVSSSNETIVPPLGDAAHHLQHNNKEEADEAVDAVQVKKETVVADDCNGEGGSSDAERPEAEQDDTIDSMAALSFPTVSSGNNNNNLDILRNHHHHHESSIISFLRADAVEKQRERRFACPFCGKCVRSKENLKLHVRKHTGERPFVCLFCGRAFGGKSDLTRHLRIHTGERPYHCDMCGKCFARADYLSKHLTTHINTSR